MGNLDLSVTEDILIEYFSEFYDSVSSTKIVVDPSTNESKGFGFVKFRNFLESMRAIEEINGKVLNGSRIKLR